MTDMVKWESKWAFCDDLDSPLLGMILDQAWLQKESETLKEWFDNNGAVLTGSFMSGMLFLLPNEETKLMFVLRWS